MNGDEREYGIGRVPADVDPTDEALAELDAAEKVAHMQPTPHQSVEMGTCDYCGRQIPRYLLMSASVGTACPACYDDSEERYR